MTKGLGQGARSWQRALLIAVMIGSAIFAVSLVPYLLASATAPSGKVFNGFFYLADDASTYVAKMRQGADGDWGWHDPYISRPVATPVLLFAFYILWGKVAAFLHLSMYAGYHLARLSGAIALVAGARLLAQQCLPAGRARLVAVALALGGSGLGWILQLSGALAGTPQVGGQKLDALELHLPELSGFYSIIAIPHFAWAAALMAFAVVGLVGIADGEGVIPVRALGLASLSLLALCFIHPQMLFVLAPLAGAYLAMRRRQARAYLLVGLPFLLCLPPLLYFLRVLTGDPVVVAWAAQWRHQAPDLLGLLFGLGLPLVLAVVAASRWLSLTPLLRLMAVWLGLVMVMLYLPNPVNIQRRLIDGIYLPVAILAAAGLEVVIKGQVRTRLRPALSARSITTLALGLSLLMSTLVWSAGILAALSREPVIYLDRGEVAAMDWLSSHRPSGLSPAVLSHPLTGLFIPAHSGYRVYVGHYSETIDYRRKGISALGAFGAGPDAVAQLAHDEGTNYIFYGALEQEVGARAGTSQGVPGADAIYQRDGVVIYRLR